jgi:hypothetical protein
MKSDQSSSPKRGARVLSFRRGQPPTRSPQTDAAPGLDKYERDDSPDDYRHRMLINLAAFVVLILLIGGGYWLADTMARMRKDQDCVLSGRRNCAPVHVEGTRVL